MGDARTRAHVVKLLGGALEVARRRRLTEPGWRVRGIVVAAERPEAAWAHREEYTLLVAGASQGRASGPAIRKQEVGGERSG